MSVLQALQLVNAIQVRGQHNQQQQQGAHSSRRGGPAGPAADLIDTSAQQQVAALGALVALLLQLQVSLAELQSQIASYGHLQYG